MKRIAIFIFIFLLFACTGLFCDRGESEHSLLNTLKTIPGLSVVKVLKPNLHFNHIIQLAITQPLDHQNPKTGTFRQTIFLSPQSWSPTGTAPTRTASSN